MKTEFSFGRLVSPPDERDHLMSAAAPGLAVAPRVDRFWQCKTVLQQGNVPACVGFSWAHWGICAPIEQKWGNPMGISIYRACKKVDGMPDEDGSTLRAGAQVMLDRGRIQRYFWAHSVVEALGYVSTYGPVVFGTRWWEGMCRPSLLTSTIRPTGKVVGGHAYAVTGVQWSKNRARIHQSWGSDWGDGGECWISIPDLVKVYQKDGEACAAWERAMPTGGIDV